MTAKTFNALWAGDRFTAFGSLWTKIGHDTARQHSPESVKLGEDGYGYLGDTICSFATSDPVEFDPPAGVLAAAAPSTIGEVLKRSGLDAYIKDGDLAHLNAALKFAEMLRAGAAAPARSRDTLPVGWNVAVAMARGASPTRDQPVSAGVLLKVDALLTDPTTSKEPL